MKIIIAGTGRTGTTFLVQMFTDLGFNTGFKDSRAHFNEEIRAGYEPRTIDEIKEWLNNEEIEIIKTPAFSYRFEELVLDSNVINCAIVPVRKLETVARSRLNHNSLKHMVGDEETAEERMAYVLGKCVESLVLNNIPIIFIKFPEMVKNRDYLYDKLNGITKLNRKKFNLAFEKLAKPEMIETK